jgi:phage terminase large subunit GpA-like protein
MQMAESSASHRRPEKCSFGARWGMRHPARVVNGTEAKAMSTEILHSQWQSLLSKSACSACGGLAQPAVHTHSAAIGTQEILYLAETWACSVCGRQWEDERLRKLNARAAYAARAKWIANMPGSAPASRDALRGPQPSFPNAHFADRSSPIEAKTIVSGRDRCVVTEKRVA